MRRRNLRPRRSRRPAPALSLAIPCFNEEAVVRATAQELIAAFAARRIPVELVLVDNGSSDGTGRAIDAMIAAGWPVRKVIVKVNRGFGFGVLKGLDACRAPLIGFTCADGPVAPAEVVRIFEATARARRPVLAKAARRNRQDGAFRMFTSRVYRALAALLYWNLNVVDINATPKIFPRAAWPALRPASLGSSWDLELLLNARRAGLGIVERPGPDRRRAE